MVSKTQKHPLEGKYIVFRYSEADSCCEGSSLVLYQLKNNNLKSIFHPCNELLGPGALGVHLDDQLLALMKKRGIKEVYSVFHLDDFFGIPADWYSLESESHDKKREIECWGEYESICSDDGDHDLLTENGIEVKFWEEPSKPQDNPTKPL